MEYKSNLLYLTFVLLENTNTEIQILLCQLNNFVNILKVIIYYVFSLKTGLNITKYWFMLYI